MTMDPSGTADDGQTSAAPGWYPDPHEPGSLRYFDGTVWTEHRHKDSGGLPAVGAWLSSTFSAVSENFLPAALLSFGLQLVGSVLVWLIVRTAVGDLAFQDQELVNVDTGEIVGFVVLVVVMVVWRGFSNIARDRFMQRAHMQSSPSVAEALRRAVTRLPRWIGLYLLIAAAWIVAMSLVAVGALVNGALAVFLLFIVMGAGVVVWFRLAFISAAVAAVPAKKSAVASSAEVTRGRFWSVVGRLLLVWIGVAIAGQVVGVASQGVTALVDINAFTEFVTIEEDGAEPAVVVADFALVELVPSFQSFLIFGVISAVLGSLFALLSSSAIMRLYLEAGGASDVSSHEPVR